MLSGRKPGLSSILPLYMVSLNPTILQVLHLVFRPWTQSAFSGLLHSARGTWGVLLLGRKAALFLKFPLFFGHGAQHTGS